MRVNVNLDEQLIKEIDEKAKQLFLSRSAYISMACATYNRTMDRYKSLTENIDKDLKESKGKNDMKNLLDKLKNE